MNEALKLFKTAIFPRYSCFEWGKLYEREWVCYLLCLSLWTPCEYGSWQTGQAARVLKSPRLLRTLCELHSTSKANLPLPGDAHGLIRYLVSALMRSGLYHWGGMSRGTMRARKHLPKALSNNECNVLHPRGWNMSLSSPAVWNENNVHSVLCFENHEIMMHTCWCRTLVFSANLDPFVPQLSISSLPLSLSSFIHLYQSLLSLRHPIYTSGITARAQL